MTAPSPIRSRAQHDMLTRALAEPDYAAQRGISAELARRMLADHQAAGAPDLPDRVAPATRAGSAPRRKRKFLGSD